MAVGVADMVVDPLITVHQVLHISGLAGNIDMYITCHSLTIMDNFEYMHHDKTHQVVKMYNDNMYRLAAQKIGFLVQKKLKGLLCWHQDKV